MKKINVFLFLFVAFASSVYAQIEEGSASLSTQGSKNALMIDLPAAKVSDVKDLWSKYMNDNYHVKPKYDRKAQESMADNVLIKDMSNNTVDVWASFRESGNGTRLTVWFDLGGAFLNSRDHAQGFTTAQKLLLKFAIEIKKEQVNETLKEEKKKLSKRQSELKDLVREKKNMEDDINGWLKDNDNYRKKIADNENKVSLNKNKIEKNIDTQKQKQSEVDDQAQHVKDVEKQLHDLDN